MKTKEKETYKFLLENFEEKKVQIRSAHDTTRIRVADYLTVSKPNAALSFALGLLFCRI